MNERIKELLLEAEQSVQFLSNSVDSKKQIVMDKFSELIVKECIDVIINVQPGYKDYRNQIEDAFKRDAIEIMKNHFGVE